MNKLVVPPMPNIGAFFYPENYQEALVAWGSIGWQTAQRESALADKLVEALEKVAIGSVDQFRVSHFCRICIASAPVEGAIKHEAYCELFSAALNGDSHA